MLHHYGSSLNAIPLLTEFRDHPDDIHLLRVGYAGMMGSLTNIAPDGFPSMAFHAFPDTLSWDARTGDYGLNFFGPGMVIPEYREGDSVWPGRPVADVMESGKMEVRAKIAESDRANLTAGQPASLYVDALPGETFVVKVGALSGLASRAQWYDSATVTRLFDVTFQFDKPDDRLKAGSSARLTIEGKEIPDALHVPRQAVLEKNGKTHVYVKVGDRFEQREVKVENFTESRAVIAGLSEGTEVALTDPTVARPTSNSSSPTLPAAGGSR